MNEKMQVLKMLEEGKITADEASRLLDKVGKPTPSPTPKRPAPSSYGSPSSNNGRPPAGAGTSTGGTSGFDDFASDLSKKFETLAKDFEPKIQKFTEIMVEKTAGVADKISKSISEPSKPAPYQGASPSSTAGRPPTPAPSPGGRSATPGGPVIQGVEKSFESSVLPGPNELNIAGFNAPVVVKGYNGDKITMKVTMKARRTGADVELMKLGNKYSLSYEESDFERISVDAYIPAEMFYSINIQSINGVLDVSNIKAEYAVLSNSGGDTQLAGLDFKNLKVDCNNGKLTLQNLRGENGQIENFNGEVIFNTPDVANLRLSSFNGGIHVTVPYFDKYSEYIWLVETSNAKLNLNLPSSPQLGYFIKAHTSLSDIKLGLTGINFLSGDNSNVEAKSVNYDTAPKHVKLSLETSNAPITVS